MTTPTPDETVTRLAEAMSSEFPDAYGNAYRHWSEVALRAIAADPSLAGFPAHVASEWDYGIPVTSPIILLPDPDPPAPELPSVREQVAANLYTANRHRKVDWSNLEGPSRLGWLNHADLLLKEFDITPKAAAEGDVSCG